MYDFTNKNSWLMIFFLNCEKDEKMTCNERNLFSNSWLMKKRLYADWALAIQDTFSKTITW